jgi:hypothetical protein
MFIVNKQRRRHRRSAVGMSSVSALAFERKAKGLRDAGVQQATKVTESFVEVEVEG